MNLYPDRGGMMGYRMGGGILEMPSEGAGTGCRNTTSNRSREPQISALSTASRNSLWDLVETLLGGLLGCLIRKLG